MGDAGKDPLPRATKEIAETLVQKDRSRILRICEGESKRFGLEADADDVYQEVCIRVCELLRRAPATEQVKLPSLLIRKIARGICIDERRKRSVDPEKPGKFRQVPTDPEDVDSHPSAFDIEEVERKAALKVVIETLRQKARGLVEDAMIETGYPGAPEPSKARNEVSEKKLSAARRKQRQRLKERHPEIVRLMRD